MAFSDEVRDSVAGGGPASGWRGEEARLNNPQRKGGGGLGAPLTVEEFVTTEATRQRWWRAWAGARRSGGDVVDFRHERWRGRDGAREMRRGGVGSAAASSDTAGQKWPVGTTCARRGEAASASSDTAGRDVRARGEAMAWLGQRRGAVSRRLYGTAGVRRGRRGRVAATRRRRANRRARRGKRRLTGGPLMSAISVLKFTPGRK
jgi:hypothetical protein